jgi:hypothetical protein
VWHSYQAAVRGAGLGRASIIAMARGPVVAQGSDFVAWRLNASSYLGARQWCALLTVVAALGTSQCAFPQHTFFEENCFNGKDDDGNGDVDCQDPACAQKVTCLATLPTWSGPVAVWHGSGSATPPDCGLSGSGEVVSGTIYYTGDIHLGDAAGTCPPCTCTPGTSHCTARLRLYQNDKCEVPIGTEDAAYSITSKCSAVSFASGVPMIYSYYAKADAPVPTDACTAQSQPLAFTAPSWDFQVKLCNPRSWTCPPETCVAYPSAPFDNALCVFAPGELDCPSGYTHRELVYRSNDTRDCSPCSCTPSGLSCPPDAVVGDYSGPGDCTGSQRFAIATNSLCTKVNVQMTNPLNFALKNIPSGPVGDVSCLPSARTLTGSVGKGPAVTLCCTSLQPQQ